MSAGFTYGEMFGDYRYNKAAKPFGRSKVKYTVELEAVGCEMCEAPLPEAHEHGATACWRLLEFKKGIREEGDEIRDFCSLECLGEWVEDNKPPIDKAGKGVK